MCSVCEIVNSFMTLNYPKISGLWIAAHFAVWFSDSGCFGSQANHSFVGGIKKWTSCSRARNMLTEKLHWAQRGWSFHCKVDIYCFVFPWHPVTCVEHKSCKVARGPRLWLQTNTLWCVLASEDQLWAGSGSRYGCQIWWPELHEIQLEPRVQLKETLLHVGGLVHFFSQPTSSLCKPDPPQTKNRQKRLKVQIQFSF